MVNKVFINDAFTKAINDYQSSSENVQGIIYNSFLVVVVRMLICLYGELDVINPMMAEDEDLLKANLSKFGYDKVNIETFLSNLELFYEEDQNEKLSKKKSNYFVMIQNELVDMLICKKLNFYLTDVETKEFYNLLYTPFAPHPLRVSYNFLKANDPLEVDKYFKEQMSSNVKAIKPIEKHYLNFKAYEVLNYSIEDIKKMPANEIESVNAKVYDYFKIRENAINKEYLLEKAIEAKERENSKVTSGNGYVDILLVISVICTIAMVVGIVTFLIV